MTARSDASLIPYVRWTQGDGPSLDQCATALGMSTARAGQLERTGLARLRRCFQLIEEGMPVDAAVEQCRGRVGRPRKRGRP